MGYNYTKFKQAKLKYITQRCIHKTIKREQGNVHENHVGIYKNEKGEYYDQDRAHGGGVEILNY